MKKLPVGVAIIGGLVIIEAILEILAAFGFMGVSTLGMFVSMIGPSMALLVIGILFLIIGLIELAVGIGLFNMEKWAWTLSVIVLWIDVVLDVLAGFTGMQTLGSVLLSMIIPVVVLLYLYNKQVRRAFA